MFEHLIRHPVYQHMALAEMRARHPDWIWHRSDTHVVLGVPGSLEGMKTVVEPGNAFSPGPRTFGVTTWVYDRATHTLYAPEQMPLEDLHWSFAEPGVPVLVSTWSAGAVQVTSRLFTDGDPARSDIHTHLAVTASNPTAATAEVSLYVVVRSFGAAGGPIRHLGPAADGRALEINHFPLLYYGEAPAQIGAVSYAETGQDIGEHLQRGELPATEAAEDASTWASGALEYRLSLAPGERRTFSFLCPVKADHRLLTWLERPAAVPDAARAEESVAARWREQQTVQLTVPDARFREAFYAQLTHLYMFTVAEAPRICPISYPIWWLRDGAFVVQALDKGGFADFAERACLAVMEKVSFGGFGSEGDGPGEAIWMLTEHYLLTRDADYLRTIYPHLVAKAELLMKMRRATTPLKLFTEFVSPDSVMEPVIDLFCAPAKHGLIQGRMDWHYPVFWINGFAYLALRRVAECAEVMGEAAHAARFRQEAQELRQALCREIPRSFGRNPRDASSALWPSGWAREDGGALAGVREAMLRFWEGERCPHGVYTREPLWTYFEAGQTHNFLFLGEREKAWRGIGAFLTEHTAPGLYTYHEGNHDENSFDQWQRVRGWDHIRYVTPHGWTAAEVFLLLRDCLLYEEGNALVIGAGVPATWLSGTEPFGIANAPSHFGLVSWHYDPKTKRLRVSVARPPSGGLRLQLAHTQVVRSVPWVAIGGRSEVELNVE